MAALGASLARSWCDLELKHPNRSYFYKCGESGFRSSFVPWPGALPMFKQLRGLLVSKDIAARDAMLPVDGASVCLLEMVFELTDL